MERRQITVVRREPHEPTAVRIVPVDSEKGTQRREVGWEAIKIIICRRHSVKLDNPVMARARIDPRHRFF
jgi:hypothetical protein